MKDLKLCYVKGSWAWFTSCSLDNQSGIGIIVNDNDIIEQASKKNFDYLMENPCSDTSIYGDY